MAGRWSDEDIAATLNRMALPTEQGQAWNAIRVGPYPRTTTVEAAAKAGVSCHATRKLLQSGILPARQVVFDAPWQIFAVDLDRPEVQQALRRCRHRSDRPQFAR